MDEPGQQSPPDPADAAPISRVDVPIGGRGDFGNTPAPYLAPPAPSRDDVALPGAKFQQPTLDDLLAKTPPRDRDLVRSAYDLALQFHQGQTRSSGEPYISHPLAVATLVADLKLDGLTIGAALLHDVLEDTHVSLRDLQKQFPHDLVRIVEGVTKITRISFASKKEQQTENLRKLFLAMAQDIRVVIVKLCDRLHNMRTLKHLDEEKRIAISRETLDIFAPLAGRLGIMRIKSELEDASMRWLFPQEYKSLTRQFDLKRRERDERIAECVAHLREKLGPQFPRVEVVGRSKHFYSIFKKMRDNNLSFEEIYDLNAVRIICHKSEECYPILATIHAMWRPIPGRFKDYVNAPKRNGYQSLHTTVVGLHGEVTEVQIRTSEMHRHAEYGIAAHWMYKESESDVQKANVAANRIRESLNWVRDVIDSLAEEKEPGAFFEGLKTSIIDDVVICFSPKGDVYELPFGATPIDFAFAIHTDIGFHCTGAKINGRMVNLRTEIKNGDAVEILTNPSGHPSRDWLDNARTPRAKSKIRHWFKSKELDVWMRQGRQTLEKLLTENDIRFTRTELDQKLEALAKELRFSSSADLQAEIAFGGVSAHAIAARLYRLEERQQERRGPHRQRVGKRASIVIPGMENTDIGLKLGACCHPVPGEPITAFVTRGRGVTVHRTNCLTIERTKKSTVDRQRLIPAYWEGGDLDYRTVPIYIECDDRAGLLNDITRVFSQAGVYIDSAHTRTNHETRIAYMRITCKVSSLDQLEEVLQRLSSVPGVRNAERSSRPV